MGSPQHSTNMWSLVSSVKLSPTQTPLSTETTLEKEDAIHAIRQPAGLSTRDKLQPRAAAQPGRSQALSPTNLPLTRGPTAEGSAEELAWWTHGPKQEHRQACFDRKPSPQRLAGHHPWPVHPGQRPFGPSFLRGSAGGGPGLGGHGRMLPPFQQGKVHPTVQSTLPREPVLGGAGPAGSSGDRALLPAPCWKQTSPAAGRARDFFYQEPVVDPWFLPTTSAFNRETSSQSDIFGN